MLIDISQCALLIGIQYHVKKYYDYTKKNILFKIHTYAQFISTVACPQQQPCKIFIHLKLMCYDITMHKIYI